MKRRERDIEKHLYNKIEYKIYKEYVEMCVLSSLSFAFTIFLDLLLLLTWLFYLLRIENKRKKTFSSVNLFFFVCIVLYTNGKE